MTKQYFVSIIIPTYNSKKFLIQTFNSIINQTYQNFEIIFVDDCSIDGTYEYLKKLKKKFKNKIKILRTKKNSGTVAAPRNLGIKYSRGDVISFVDSDDIWEKNKLDFQINNFKSENYIHFTAAKYFNSKNEKSGILINTFRRLLQIFIINRVNKKGFHWFYLYNPIIVSSVLIHKNILNNNLFDENINSREDLDMWIRLRKKNHKFYFNNKILLNIFRRPDSMSSDFKKELVTLIRSKSNVLFKLNNFSNLNFFLIGTIIKFFLTFIKINLIKIKNFSKYTLFIFIFFYFIVYYTPAFWYLGNSLLYKDKIDDKNSKNLVVFSGHGSTSYYNMTYLYRFKDILKISEANKIKNIYILGRLQDIPEQKIIEKLLISEGFEQNKIKLIYEEFNNTYKNIINVDKILKKDQIEDIVFITSPYHTKRTKLLWEKNSDIKVKLFKGHDWPKKNKIFEYSKNKKIILYEHLSIVFNKLFRNI